MKGGTRCAQPDINENRRDEAGYAANISCYAENYHSKRSRSRNIACWSGGDGAFGGRWQMLAEEAGAKNVSQAPACVTTSLFFDLPPYTFT